MVTTADEHGARWVRALPTPEERAAEVAELERLVERDRRRDLCVVGLEGALSLAVGLALVGWAFHTENVSHGWLALLSGLLLGNAGVLLALAHAYFLAVERGDI